MRQLWYIVWAIPVVGMAADPTAITLRTSRATIGQRLPDARSGVRSGQISVFLAGFSEISTQTHYVACVLTKTSLRVALLI